jgi:aspartate racemase
MREIIGVLGGMGPAATADFFGKLLRATPARSDQEHLPVLIYSNPQIPDRTAAIRGEGPDPLPELVRSAEALVRAGASFLAIPCVTAHAFFEPLQRAVAVPILHLVDETVRFVRTERPGIRQIGLLATTGTVQSRLFHARFEPHGLTVLTCDPAIQADTVMAAIYGIKGTGTLPRSRALIQEAGHSLIAKGAEAIVAGCTEVPLILQDGDLPVPVIDATWILAQAAVRRALGHDPRPRASQRCYKDGG